MAKFITHKETANIIGITQATLTAWVKNGCPCIYVGKVTTSRRGARPRYQIEEVEQWIKERSKKGTHNEK